MKNISKLMALLLALTLGTQLASCGDDAGTDVGNQIYSQGLDENGFFEGVKASEIVVLPEYKGLDVDAGIPVATEDELNEQLEQILSTYNSYDEIRDRAVVDGDTVNIDYVGYVGDKQFDGGNTGGLGTTVTIGVTNYIEGFLDQLIGHKPGETFDVYVTFPEDYKNDELAGNVATFKTTINYIQGEFIKAELSDTIAADYGFESADALLADVNEWIVSSAKYYFFIDVIAKATCENIPESVIEYIKNYDLSQYAYYANMYGMTTESYIQAVLGHESIDAYVESKAEDYRIDATRYLAAQAIAEIENITVTDEMIEKSGNAEYIAEYGKPYIKQFMLFQEVIPQFIIDNGNLVETSEETEAETIEE